MAVVSIYFLTQCRLIYRTTLIHGDIYIPSSTCTCSRVRVSRWLKVTNQFWSPLTYSNSKIYSLCLHKNVTFTVLRFQFYKYIPWQFRINFCGSRLLSGGVIVVIHPRTVPAVDILVFCTENKCLLMPVFH